MKTRSEFLLLGVLALISSACQPAPAPATEPAATIPPSPTDLPAPTNTPVPTNTALPTETPIPTATPLPAGVLFRDDFDGGLQPDWEWQYEKPDRWSITEDGWLKIIGDVDMLLVQDRQNNLLWYPLPEGDFAITVHLKTKPFENFHQAAIFIYEDPENYVTINRGYCSFCVAGGNGFFMDYKIGGQFGSYKVAATAEDVYLRLESEGNTISGYYATAPDQWKRVGRFGNYFQFKKVGIGVSKASAGNAVIGLFDYFEIVLPD